MVIAPLAVTPREPGRVRVSTAHSAPGDHKLRADSAMGQGGDAHIQSEGVADSIEGWRGRGMRSSRVAVKGRYLAASLLFTQPRTRCKRAAQPQLNEVEGCCHDDYGC